MLSRHPQDRILLIIPTQVVDAEPMFGVVRGGCWRFEAALCRSAERYRYLQNYGIDTIGFRVALVGSTLSLDGLLGPASPSSEPFSNQQIVWPQKSRKGTKNSIPKPEACQPVAGG